jgi:hypothetical protein
MSIEETERASVTVIKHHDRRVSLASIETKIVQRWDRTLDSMLDSYPASAPDPRLAHVSVCTLLLDNGFVVIGMSAPVTAENFDAGLGKKFAYEDAIRKLWPMAGYAMRERISAAIGER